MQKKWFFIAVLFPVMSFSQDDKTRPHFNTIVSVGYVAGEGTAKPLIQAESGLNYDRWFAGFGAGLDFYNFKSAPLFADTRVKLGKKRLLFLYVSGGYNFPFGNESIQPGFFKTFDRFYGGFYMDAGAGYDIRLNTLHHLLLSAGYSRKNIVNQVGYTYIPCSAQPCSEEMYRYHYTMGRIIARLSWQIGK